MASRVVAEAVLFAQRHCTFCFLTITSFFFFIFLQYSGEVYITSTRAQNKLLFVAHSVNSCSVSGRRRVINWPPTRAAAPTAALDAESCAAFFMERCGMWRGVHIVRTENEIKNSSAQRIFVISHDGRSGSGSVEMKFKLSFLTRIFFYWAVISAKKTRGQRNQDVFLFPRNSEGSETGKVSFWQDVFWPSVRFKLRVKKKNKKWQLKKRYEFRLFCEEPEKSKKRISLCVQIVLSLLNFQSVTEKEDGKKKTLLANVNRLRSWNCVIRLSVVLVFY